MTPWGAIPFVVTLPNPLAFGGRVLQETIG